MQYKKLMKDLKSSISLNMNHTETDGALNQTKLLIIMKG